VEPDPLVAFVPVKAITVTAKDNTTEMESRKKLQFSAELEPGIPSNKDYVWSVSDPSAASISSTGVLTSKALTEDKTVTVTATSCDTKGVSGSYKILIHKVDPKAFTASWFDSDEASRSPYAGTSDNMDVATAGSAGLSGDGQNWSNNPSKYNASYSDGGISYSGYSSPIKGKDVVYVDFPITAKQNLELEQIIISFGNHGTGNVAASVQLIRSGVAEELFADTSRKARQVRKTFPLGEKITANETIKIRVALYGYANEDTQIDTGKAPTIGTVQISGRAE
ncbi:MAG: Ig-like domain-containing protein, partial [Treponema sp.]|nr:Ig-like domain-containing protein [Treponema sp.]